MGLPKPILSEDEYLAMERAALERHVYLDGEVFAMAGASDEHKDISTNVVVSLANQLGDGPCRVWAHDARVRSGPLPKSPKRSAGLYSYPDIVVVCGEPKHLDEHKDVLLNPKALIEILSESTESFDRGKKFERLQRFNPTLTDYILISQDEPKIEHFHRESEDEWKYRCYVGMKASVKIESIQCKLKAADVYRRIKFADPEGE